MRILPIFLIGFLATSLVASDEGAESGKLPASVLRHDLEQGFQLSDAALKRLGIRFEALEGVGPWEIPQGALVRIKRSVGVYREVNGYLTFVVVETFGVGARVRVRSDDLRAGDRIAVEGGAFLRVIDLDLSGSGGDSCG